jgi:hypothetical protein
MAGSNDRPDPMELLQQFMGSLFGGQSGGGSGFDVWARATDQPKPKVKEPSADQQRENLAFALAERAVTALEDIALNTAAIRQLLRGTRAQSED